MRTVALLLAVPLLAGAARTHPLPVSSIGGVSNPDGTITINWTLPADPTITGLRIFRERLDAFDEVIFNIVGLTTIFTDTSAQNGRSYRYWVQTRNAQGQLSDAVYIEFIDDDDFDNAHWTCWASAAGGGPPASSLLLLAAALLLAAFLRRP